MFCEHSPYSTNIASDWPRSRALLWMRKIIRNKKMDDGVVRFFTRFGGNINIYLLTCGRRSLVSGTQNDIIVSWITLWGMIKIYWLDLTLAYIFDHAVCCASASKFRPKLASHSKPVKNEVKFVELSEPCSAKSSMKFNKETNHSSSNCPKYFRRTNIRPVSTACLFIIMLCPECSGVSEASVSSELNIS